jgi:hypothetical protein
VRCSSLFTKSKYSGNKIVNKDAEGANERCEEKLWNNWLHYSTVSRDQGPGMIKWLSHIIRTCIGCAVMCTKGLWLLVHYPPSPRAQFELAAFLGCYLAARNVHSTHANIPTSEEQKSLILYSPDFKRRITKILLEIRTTFLFLLCFLPFFLRAIHFQKSHQILPTCVVCSLSSCLFGRGLFSVAVSCPDYMLSNDMKIIDDWWLGTDV